MRNFIKGYNELEKKLGYEPNFHDDKIQRITLDENRLEFTLKTVDNVVYNLIFEDIEDINLHGEILGIVGIILDVGIKEVDGKLKTTIMSSLGVDGKIISKRIAVKINN